MDMTTTGVESSRLHLLETLKEFTENAVRDLILPLNPKSERGAERKERTAEVYLMRLPNENSGTKKRRTFSISLSQGKTRKSPDRVRHPRRLSVPCSASIATRRTKRRVR